MAGKTRVGIQLIVFGKRSGEDLDGVLRDVKAAGYDGAETGNLTRQGVQDPVGLFHSHGLSVTGMHSGYGDFENHEILKANVEFLKLVDARYLMCSGVAQGDGLDAYQRSAETFNRAGEYCAKNGIHLCYHNHNWEFKRFPTRDRGEVIALHELCALTDPEYVKLCVDVYWVAVGGEDPATFIQRYADRSIYFHFKDGEWEPGTPGKATRFLELGNGRVDLRSALAAASALSPEWIVTEQDTPNERSAEECAKESRVFLRTLGL